MQLSQAGKIEIFSRIFVLQTDFRAVEIFYASKNLLTTLQYADCMQGVPEMVSMTLHNASTRKQTSLNFSARLSI